MPGEARIIHGVKHVMPSVVIKSAKGSFLYTECGRKLLDFSCGIGVTNLGHSYDRVTNAVVSMASNLVHAQQNIFKHRPLLDLADKLSLLSLSKLSGFDSWFLWNSGSEIVEASLKLARQATGKPNIIAVSLGYHGRTMGTMALTTSSTIYRAGFGPLMGGVFIAPFPYLLRSSHIQNETQIHSNEFSYWGSVHEEIARKETDRCLEALELLLRTQTTPSETAALIIEPVLGEGGYLPCPPGYLRGIREICSKHGILLIADEVQTGFGRTGSMFASDWIDGGVSPDILVMAKGLANGYPIAAMGTRSDLAIKQPPGSMGGTYGGNAVGCAAALAVLESFEKDGILENVRDKEIQLISRLMDLKSRYPGIILDVRGRGLMIGVEFVRGRASAAAVAKACHDRDLVILSCGPYETLRFIPPLTVTTEELQLGLDRFEAVIRDVYENK